MHVQLSHWFTGNNKIMFFEERYARKMICVDLLPIKTLFIKKNGNNKQRIWSIIRIPTEKKLLYDHNSIINEKLYIKQQSIDSNE